MAHTAAITGPFVRVTRQEELVNFAQVLAGAFSNDRLSRYLYLGRESRPDHPKNSQHDERVRYWLPAVQSRFEKDSLLLQSFDWAAVALW